MRAMKLNMNGGGNEYSFYAYNESIRSVVVNLPVDMLDGYVSIAGITVCHRNACGVGARIIALPAWR